jgi:lambda-carrageenase
MKNDIYVNISMLFIFANDHLMNFAKALIQHAGAKILSCNILKTIVGGPFFIFLLVFPSCNNIGSGGENRPMSFSTNGKTVYQLRTGLVEKAHRAVITASIDGIIQCFSLNGELLWQASTDEGFPFDLCVADIDNDGLDEILVASGNGSLYAFDNNGKTMWVFSKLPPLYQVSVATKADGSAVVITGGVEQILYFLSPLGEVVGELKTEHCIRHIRAGKKGDNKTDFVAVATTSSGLSGFLSLLQIDPADISIVWEKLNLGTFAHNTGKRFFSMLLQDINKDGCDEILLSGGWGENGRLYAYNCSGEDLFITSDEKIPNIPYRMNLLRYVELPDDEFILGHFGNVLIVYEPDGTFREVITGPYSFVDSYFDKTLNILFMGSSVCGGDDIYAFHLDQSGWQEVYKSIQPIGKLAEIERNLNLLSKQIENFKPPAYQQPPKQTMIIAPKLQNMDFENVSFIKVITLSQQIGLRDELWCKEIDRRRSYDLSAAELNEIVLEHESSGQDFVIWAGHGTRIYFPLSSFERAIKSAPNHLKGFIFAEMESSDQHMQDIVSEIILPLAELCRKHEKLIFLRNKNIFWNGSCYLPFWNNVLFNEKYSNVFVPGLEETNCRTQELSLSGRVGLWQMGYFNRWLGRATTDNVNFDRMFEWGGHQLITHHFRNLVSSASFGADAFYNTLAITDLSFETQKDTSILYAQLVPFYKMLEKGIIHIPDREELLSISELAIGMKGPPSNTYIKHGSNGHQYWFPNEGKPEMVFDRLDTYWGGSSLDLYDFSYYAMNVKRRMTNFLPETPYGLIQIIPLENKPDPRIKKIIATDGQFFYDGFGIQHSASEYKPVVEDALDEAAKRLVVLVKGEVHWSVVKIDEEHLRITLIDPGYLDPAERNAEIILQHVDGISCTDILSGESLPIIDGRISASVPTGIFKIMDLKHH